MDIDTMISRLLNISKSCLVSAIDKDEMTSMCDRAALVFASQSSLIEIRSNVVVCGDIHGQYSDLLRIFDKLGFPPTTNYLFIGDMVDRGRQSLETIALLFCFKIKYPLNFFLLRGNHECSRINHYFGFYNEVMERYESEDVWTSFQRAFSQMPYCALIGRRILCMHGGLSPRLQSIDQLRHLQRPWLDPARDSLEFDLLWADPRTQAKDYTFNSCRRGSYSFSANAVMNACIQLDIELIIRAHQLKLKGYEFFADNHLVTVFTAPNYCSTFNNDAAVIIVDANLYCTPVILRPTV